MTGSFHGASTREPARAERRPARFAFALLLWLAACSGPVAAPGDTAEIQSAVAAHMVRDVTRSPGPLEGICIGYAGAGDTPASPDAPSARVTIGSTDDCEEVDGVLRLRRGGGPAISIHVGEPESVGGTRSRVGVLTSTGPVDVAAYRCEVIGGGAGWTVEGCELEATS